MGILLIRVVLFPHPVSTLLPYTTLFRSGEPHIGDIIELAQMLHHHLADRLGGDFALALAFQFTHDLGHRLVDELESQGDRKSTLELQSQSNLVCRLLLEKKKN